MCRGRRVTASSDGSFRLTTHFLGGYNVRLTMHFLGDCHGTGLQICKVGLYIGRWELEVKVIS